MQNNCVTLIAFSSHNFLFMLTYAVVSSKISYQQEFEIAILTADRYYFCVWHTTWKLNLVMSYLLYLLAKLLYCTEKHIWVIFSLPVLTEFDSCKINDKKSPMNTSVKQLACQTYHLYICFLY